jgi:glucose/arabinose dehydrogenase
MFSKSRLLAASSVLLGASILPNAQALEAKLELVAEGFTAPLLLIEPPDGSKRRFVIEQIGKIKIIDADGDVLEQPFLDIGHKLTARLHTFHETGLLGLAFHPNFKSNGKFYVAYSHPLNGHGDLGKALWWSHTNVVAEYQVSENDPDVANPNSERIISAVDWPQFNHNGHWIGFGPDGMLYISMGDGGYANDWGIGHNVTEGNGQDMESMLGKIHRVNVDNPNAKLEQFASGFRNPWRCAFDMGGSKQLFCGDVGQNSYEEIDIVEQGKNYGWRKMEGTHCFDYVNPNKHPSSCNKSGLTDPIIEYKNCGKFPAECEGISVTGGYVYRGATRAWDGMYFFGDWSKQFAVKDGQLFVGKQSGGKWTKEKINVTNMPGWNSYVLAFGQDGDGEVYVMSTDTLGPVGGLDKIYKIVP